MNNAMQEKPWLSSLRHYLLMVAGLNLVWEILQLPLYTLWYTGTVQSISIAIVHCTIGDIVIAISALVIALVFVGTPDWPSRRRVIVSVFTIMIGVGYTFYSESFNIARGAWAYSEFMPIIPGSQVGLAPVLQWILIPLLGFWKVGK